VNGAYPTTGREPPPVHGACGTNTVPVTAIGELFSPVDKYITRVEFTPLVPPEYVDDNDWMIVPGEPDGNGDGT
jgi:hypothetical protein